MIGIEPDVKLSGCYTVAESARLMGCDARTLNKYADFFKVVPHLNKVSRRPYYKGEQLLKIWKAAF